MRSNNDNSVVLVLYLAMLLICAVSTVSSVAGMTLDMKDADDKRFAWKWNAA